MSESIVIICPDTNIKLWATRVLEAPIGGGKSAILQLAAAWARAGHKVTLAGAAVVEGEADEGYNLRSLVHANGSYDVAIYITGSLGHFRDPAIEAIKSTLRIFWMNSPVQMSLPPGPVPDVFIAPARFLARRAIDEWGFPASRIVVVSGEATTRKASGAERVERDAYSIIYASHPNKGLDNAVRVIERVRGDYPDVRLDVFGSIRLHGDHLEQQIFQGYPEWVRFAGEVSQRDIEQHMSQYGLMLYLTSYIDGFSLASAEALAGGVIEIATAHGSNAEFIQHGWNGWLVSSGVDNQPNLEHAEDLLRQYLQSPASYLDMRARASASVPTWDEQAKHWERVWTQAR